MRTSDGAVRDIALRPQTVADFYREYVGVLDSLGIAVHLWSVPVEGDRPIPFLEDRRHASYNAEHARRFFRMLPQADRVLKRFKGRFISSERLRPGAHAAARAFGSSAGTADVAVFDEQLVSQFHVLGLRHYRLPLAVDGVCPRD